MELYHGTTAANARKIKINGFQDLKKNWEVQSKNGFVYLSTAYAPFYAMSSCKREYKLALIKIEVDKDSLFPDDDFVMLALGKKMYTQAELDKIELEDYSHLSDKSLEYMGNAAAYPKDCEIIGMREFDGKNLITKCDPIISPMNYMLMGNYYKRLTKWLYEGNAVENFVSDFCMINFVK